MQHRSRFRCEISFPTAAVGPRVASVASAEPVTMILEPIQNWQVGQKILCVDDSFSSDAVEACDFLPVSGQIYTIRAARMAHRLEAGYADVALLLEEIVNARLRYGKEPGFWQTRFKLR